MDKHTRIGIAALCLTVALLVAVASGLGVFARGDGSTETVVSERGETYEMVTTGVYAYNAERVVAEGMGWDVFTLAVAVPAMLLTLPWSVRGSLRARLVALGLLAYFFYQYLMYAMTWAFGPLFLLFVVIFAASLAGIVLIASTVRLTTLPERFTNKFPNRGIAVFGAVMGLLLVFMWLQRIRIALGGDLSEAMLLGQTTLVVQALDLGLVVPFAIFTAVMAWRARPLGYMLAAVLAVKGFTMSGAICTMLIGAWMVEGSLEAAPFAVFAAATAVSLALGIKMYRSFRVDEGLGAVPAAGYAGEDSAPTGVRHLVAS